MSSFNDGIIYVYEEIIKKNSFGVKENIKSLKDLKLLDTYFFKEESARQQDITFARSLDKKLTLKISIPYTDNIKNKDCIVICNMLYSIIHIDSSKSQKKTFIYLEGIREIERADY